MCILLHDFILQIVEEVHYPCEEDTWRFTNEISGIYKFPTEKQLSTNNKAPKEEIPMLKKMRGELVRCSTLCDPFNKGARNHF